MRQLSSEFWNFPGWSKIDVLEYPEDTENIVKALYDTETCVEEIEQGRFLFYGPDQALLVEVKEPLLQWVLALFSLLRPPEQQSWTQQ